MTKTHVSQDDEGDVPSPVWPHVTIADIGPHVTRIHVDNEERGTSARVSPPRDSVDFISNGMDNSATRGTGKIDDRDLMRQHDSIVTHSLLMMMNSNHSLSSGSVISISDNHQNDANSDNHLVDNPNLASQDKQRNRARNGTVSATKAINKARRSFRNANQLLRKSSRKITRRGKGQNSRNGSLRSGSSVDIEAVRQLWSKTGMRTNGRKLLLDATDLPEIVNDAFESDDNSNISVPRARDSRDFPRHIKHPTLRQNSSSSSSSEERKSVRKTRRYERNNQINFDKIQVANDSGVKDTMKHVRFNYSKGFLNPHAGPSSSGLNGRFSERVAVKQDNSLVWNHYYGTNNPAMIEAGISTMTSNLTSNFTIDLNRNKELRKTEKRRKNIRCCCKISCFLLLLISFLLVIITVTFFLTKGKKYFGAL